MFWHSATSLHAATNAAVLGIGAVFLAWRGQNSFCESAGCFHNLSPRNSCSFPKRCNQAADLKLRPREPALRDCTRRGSAAAALRMPCAKEPLPPKVDFHSDLRRLTLFCCILGRSTLVPGFTLRTTADITMASVYVDHRGECDVDSAAREHTNQPPPHCPTFY